MKTSFLKLVDKVILDLKREKKRKKYTHGLFVPLDIPIRYKNEVKLTETCEATFPLFPFLNVVLMILFHFINLECDQSICVVHINATYGKVLCGQRAKHRSRSGSHNDKYKSTVSEKA